jgi:aryl-alcohol dehydrogenase-like predicted oxidoreductase
MVMVKRELGKTGVQVSVIGAGDLADRTLPFGECVATLQRAISAGVNVIDTAPGYEDGYSEEIVGAAIKARRDDLFVITKIDDFDRPVTVQLTESLSRLDCGFVDGYVFHGLSDIELYQHLNRPGGEFDELASLKQQGLVRFGGISSHHPDVLRQAILDGRCDIAMFPIGAFVDRRYIDETLPLCRAHGVGSICFKTFGAGKLVTDTEGYGRPVMQRPRGKLSTGGIDSPISDMRLTIEECLHYTLTVNPDVALLGMSFVNEQKQAFAALESFVSLDALQMRDIESRAVLARAGKGPCWWNPDPNA